MHLQHDDCLLFSKFSRLTERDPRSVSLDAMLKDPCGLQGGVGLPWDQPVKVAGNIGRGCKLEVDYTIEGNDRAGVHATILIDISGSMHGERLQIVSAALRKLIKTCFAGDDLLTIWTFKGTIYPLIKCKPKRDVGLGRLFSDMRNHCKPSGHPECQTCLYDCISRAHTELCKHAQHHSGYQRFFIVFTDGEDTASSSTARQAWMQLQASPVPCLRTIFITAGLSKTSEVFDAVPSGGKIFRAETDAGEASFLFLGLIHMPALAHVACCQFALADFRAESCWICEGST